MSRRKPRSGAEICRELMLSIPDDVCTAFELQAFVEAACDIERAVERGAALDPLPQTLLDGYVTAERAFLGDEAGPPGALEAVAAEMSTAAVVVRLDARIKFLAKAVMPANAARQAAFQRAVRLWLSKRDHLYLELHTAEVVTPVDRRNVRERRRHADLVRRYHNLAGR